MSTNDAHTAVIDAVPVEKFSITKQYYELTKPGITQMVVLTTLAGFYLAIPTNIVDFVSKSENWVLFFCIMVGTILVSAGACVFNHVLERNVDARMKRTASRPIPSGVISLSRAIVFGSILTTVGLALVAFVNPVTLIMAVVTWVTYVGVYTPLKTKTKTALLIGGVPGALPFAAGWTAVSGTIELPAVILFTILFFWQLPHFLALSWMYRSDYREGGFALESNDEAAGKRVALQMIVTSFLTLLASVWLTIEGVTGVLYCAGASLLGLALVYTSFRFYTEHSVTKARHVLLTSYAVLMGIVVLMFVDKIG